MRKLFVSDEVLKLKGKEFFKDMDLWEFAMKGEGTYEGLCFSKDDMDNINFYVSEDDCAFNEIGESDE